MRCESSWPCSSFCPSSTFGTGITTTANYWMGWTACDAPSPTACFIERPSPERHTTGLPRRVAEPGLETNAETRPKPLISKVEATSGIEPEYTVLQASEGGPAGVPEARLSPVSLSIDVSKSVYM